MTTKRKIIVVGIQIFVFLFLFYIFAKMELYKTYLSKEQIQEMNAEQEQNVKESFK